MKDYLEFAKKIALKAGEIMWVNFELGMAKEWKEDNTPLTIADTSINNLVIDEVKKNFPDHGVLGEEASFETERDLLWVVDPIDGTMPFSQGIPTSVFSLALVKNGEVQVAVIQDPFSKRQYTAIKGQGAFLDDIVLSVNKQDTLGPQVFIDIAGTKGKMKFEEFDGLKLMAQLANAEVRFTKSYTAIYNALPIATAQHAASILLLQYPWDGAAISLIIEEAGGKATDLDGNKRLWNQNGKGFILSNGFIHDELLTMLDKSK